MCHVSQPTQPGSAETERVKRTVGRLLSTMSLFSALAAAVIGTIAAILLGPALAMGASFYTGNTEPVRPSAPYPWHLLAVCTAIAAGGYALSRRPDREGVGHVVLHLAAIAAALLPFLHIFQLWSLANAP